MISHIGLQVNGTFSDILQKVKTYVLPTAIVLNFNPIEIPKIIKLEPPNVQYLKLAASDPCSLTADPNPCFLLNVDPDLQ